MQRHWAIAVGRDDNRAISLRGVLASLGQHRSQRPPERSRSAARPPPSGEVRLSAAHYRRSVLSTTLTRACFGRREPDLPPTGHIPDPFETLP